MRFALVFALVWIPAALELCRNMQCRHGPWAALHPLCVAVLRKLFSFFSHTEDKPIPKRPTHTEPGPQKYAARILETSAACNCAGRRRKTSATACPADGEEGDSVVLPLYCCSARNLSCALRSEATLWDFSEGGPLKVSYVCLCIL